MAVEEAIGIRKAGGSGRGGMGNGKKGEGRRMVKGRARPKDQKPPIAPPRPRSRDDPLNAINPAGNLSCRRYKLKIPFQASPSLSEAWDSFSASVGWGRESRVFRWGKASIVLCGIRLCGVGTIVGSKQNE